MKCLCTERQEVGASLKIIYFKPTPQTHHFTLGTAVSPHGGNRAQEEEEPPRKPTEEEDEEDKEDEEEEKKNRKESKWLPISKAVWVFSLVCRVSF